MASGKDFIPVKKRFSQISIKWLRLTVNFSASGVWYLWRDQGWSLDRSPLTFSERNGYKPVRRLPFGFKLTRLINIREVPRDE
jgi:hypothetical protein